MLSSSYTSPPPDQNDERPGVVQCYAAERPLNADRMRAIEGILFGGTGRTVPTAQSASIGRVELARAQRFDQQLTDRFLLERHTLIEKKFSEGISRLEERRLNYVNWCLDQADEALYAPSFERMEALIEQQEQTAAMVRSVLDQLSTVQANRRTNTRASYRRHVRRVTHR